MSSLPSSWPFRIMCAVSIPARVALEPDAETGAALCSQPTISRMENPADTRVLTRMAHEMVRFYCASFARPPQQIVLDIDDTFDVAHGHQQLRLFNALAPPHPA